MSRFSQKALPPDGMVAAWITPAILESYSARGAFDHLVPAAAVGRVANGAMLHYVTLAECEQLLADAREHHRTSSSSLKTAYGAHVRNLERAMREAAESQRLGSSMVAARADDVLQAFLGSVLATERKPSVEERLEQAQALDELSNSDLVWLLRGAMLQQGIRPLSPADNILAHLRARLAQFESGAARKK